MVSLVVVVPFVLVVFVVMGVYFGAHNAMGSIRVVGANGACDDDGGRGAF